MKYGYVRVSSKGQDYTAQVEALKAAGCERIFSEKASGKSTDGRPEFAKLQKVLLPGDTVVVTKLDRLARSSRDLHNIVHELDGLSCGFVSLGESWCDTTTDAQADADHHGRHCRVRARPDPKAHRRGY
jgi:DNA invertase Pin-like site-specific DNA recombinase